MKIKTAEGKFFVDPKDRRRFGKICEPSGDGYLVRWYRADGLLGAGVWAAATTIATWALFDTYEQAERHVSFWAR